MNTVHFCTNCAYWMRPHPEGSPGGNSRVENANSCACPKFKFGYGYRGNDLSDDEVNVEDDEGWGFVTGPFFGCIHFARRAIE